MSNLYRPRLPSETLDHIVDFLHDDQESLLRCSRVSKSWISRARQHLFAFVVFYSAAHLESWKLLFPDASTSPARYTREVLFKCPELVTAASTVESGWIRVFSHVTWLGLFIRFREFDIDDLAASLRRFHGFSPSVKSLQLSFDTPPNSQIFALISSFPHLEDLVLTTLFYDDGGPVDIDVPQIIVRPSPAYTGTLDLSLYNGKDRMVNWLLSLPNGLHFRKVVTRWFHTEDAQSTNALIAGCSDTLECLIISISHPIPRSSVPFRELIHGSLSPLDLPDTTPVDLSKAKRLVKVLFVPWATSVEWVTLALQTITFTHQDHRELSINAFYDGFFPNPVTDARQVVEESVYGEWLRLDDILVQLVDSRPVCFTIHSSVQREELYGHLEHLLPEMTKKGTIDLVEWRGIP